MAPPIILFSEPSLLDAEEEDGTGFIQIPWDADLIAIDGETQLAARFEAANIDSSTKDAFVPVLICHGRSIDWARQVFHDLNLLAVRPNAAVGIGMDQRDPLTHVARVVEAEIPFFKNRVNKVRRQLRRTDKEIVTITALRGACVTLAEGITGVKYGARSVPVPLSRVAEIEAVAVEWFRALAEQIGPAIEDRERRIASAPAVFAALGALGHSLVDIEDADDRRAEMNRLLDLLREVNWEKGKHWEGIAGKFTPKGDFAVGGPKETAYAIYSALRESGAPAFTRVRAVDAVASSTVQG
jgi:DNA sulfur modification protein DndB